MATISADASEKGPSSTVWAPWGLNLFAAPMNRWNIALPACLELRNCALVIFCTSQEGSGRIVSDVLHSMVLKAFPDSPVPPPPPPPGFSFPPSQETQALTPQAAIELRCGNGTFPIRVVCGKLLF